MNLKQRIIGKYIHPRYSDELRKLFWRAFLFHIFSITLMLVGAFFLPWESAILSIAMGIAFIFLLAGFLKSLREK